MARWIVNLSESSSKAADKPRPSGANSNRVVRVTETPHAHLQLNKVHQEGGSGVCSRRASRRARISCIVRSTFCVLENSEPRREDLGT
eukprot:2456901-Rhodomonas_salina.2